MILFSLDLDHGFQLGSIPKFKKCDKVTLASQEQSQPCNIEQNDSTYMNQE